MAEKRKTTTKKARRERNERRTSEWQPVAQKSPQQLVLVRQRDICNTSWNSESRVILQSRRDSAGPTKPYTPRHVCLYCTRALPPALQRQSVIRHLHALSRAVLSTKIAAWWDDMLPTMFDWGNIFVSDRGPCMLGIFAGRGGE